MDCLLTQPTKQERDLVGAAQLRDLRVRLLLSAGQVVEAATLLRGLLALVVCSAVQVVVAVAQ